MRTLLNACKTFITQYITIHHNAMSRGVVPTRRLTWSEDVWQCLTVSNVSECVWQMSDMICSAKHFDPLQAAPLMKQNFLLPRCQWHLHQQHWRRHLPRNSAFTVPRWKCDMWPKTCRLVFWCLLTSYGVIAASTWMNNNAENKPFNQRITNVIYCNLCIFMIIYAWLCMYHAPSLVTYRVCPQSGLQWLSGRQKNPLQNPKQNPHGALRQCLSPVLVPVQIPQPKVPNASPANSKHLESNKFAENHRQFSGSTWLD